MTTSVFAFGPRWTFAQAATRRVVAPRRLVFVGARRYSACCTARTSRWRARSESASGSATWPRAGRRWVRRCVPTRHLSEPSPVAASVAAVAVAASMVRVPTSASRHRPRARRLGRATTSTTPAAAAGAPASPVCAAPAAVAAATADALKRWRSLRLAQALSVAVRTSTRSDCSARPPPMQSRHQRPCRRRCRHRPRRQRLGPS